MKDKWISCDERLPEIKWSDSGDVNMVLVYQKDGFDGSGDIQVWNTIYLHGNVCKFTHWQLLPPPPDREGERR